MSAADDIDEQMEQLFRDNIMKADSSSSSEEEDLRPSSSREQGDDLSAEAEWRTTGEMPSFSFTGSHQDNIGTAESPFDFFKLLFNATFMTMLVSSINTQAIRVLLESVGENSRINQWKDIDVAELQLFLALLFHMGHIRLNTINDYWRNDPLFQQPLKKFMSRDRFLLIMHNLTFQDTNLTFSPNDPNRYTKAIFNFFNSLMHSLVAPGENLTINESVVLWRDHLKTRQYIQGKRHKYGVKLYVLTDTNGITQKMHMYYGSHDVNVRGQGHAAKVVMLLMNDYLNLGHSLYMDNFYNSVKLAENLLAKKTYVTGTLKANRSRNPDITKAKIAKGSVLTRYNRSGVCVSNFRDKQNIVMISTKHNSDMTDHIRHGRTIRKPQVILMYNKYMKLVDRKDEMLAYYPSYTTSTRWYKKILVHTMQVMMLNSFMLYNSHQRRTDNGQKTLSFYDFRIEVIYSLLNVQKHTDRPTTNPAPSNRILTSRGEVIHWPVELPKNDNNKIKRKDCRYCLDTLKKRKATTYYCPLCYKNPGLCMSCFPLFHNY